MKQSTNVAEPEAAKSVLHGLERRHNDVLERLDDLNRRVELALAEARRQFPIEGEISSTIERLAS